jgi:hypothetical protein
MKRLTTTIVAIRDDRLTRVDFEGRAEEPAFIREEPRTPGTDMAEGVRDALDLGGRAGARVWVLCDEVFRQSVAMPIAQTRGMSASEIATALAYEVQPFSDLSPAEAAVGYRIVAEAEGARKYDVVACRAATRLAIRDLVRRRGGALAGMAHPDDLPALPDARANESEEERRRRWSQWRQALESAAKRIAIIAPPAPEKTAALPIAVGTFLGLCALGLCFFHGRRTAVREAAQRAELAAARRESEKARKLEHANDELRKTIAARRASEQARKEALAEVAWARRALPDFLRELARAAGQAATVRGIRHDGPGALIVHGVGLTSGGVDRLAAELADTLRGAGWTIVLHEKQAEGLLRDAGPWRFTLRAESGHALARREEPIAGSVRGTGEESWP